METLASSMHTPRNVSLHQPPPARPAERSGSSRTTRIVSSGTGGRMQAAPPQSASVRQVLSGSGSLLQVPPNESICPGKKTGQARLVRKLTWVTVSLNGGSHEHRDGAWKGSLSRGGNVRPRTLLLAASWKCCVIVLPSLPGAEHFSAKK
ncbi:MAG: hypothetical protein DMF82_08695, partial [Acidobacteria bacterium]